MSVASGAASAVGAANEDSCAAGAAKIARDAAGSGRSCTNCPQCRAEGHRKAGECGDRQPPLWRGHRLRCGRLRATVSAANERKGGGECRRLRSKKTEETVSWRKTPIPILYDTGGGARGGGSWLRRRCSRGLAHGGLRSPCLEQRETGGLGGSVALGDRSARARQREAQQAGGAGVALRSVASRAHA